MKRIISSFIPLLALMLSCTGDKTGEKAQTEVYGGTTDTSGLSASSLAVMALVKEGVGQFNTYGEKAFDSFRISGSRWRNGDNYIFVIDEKGTMMVNADSSLEGKNLIGLKDMGGKPIIKGLIQTAFASAGRQGGWYHYQWPEPGGLFPRWKSSFVMPVTSPEGKKYIMGSGIYTDRMEREFVEDMVNGAVAEISSAGDSAFALLRDKSGPYLAKDAYVVVFSMEGIDLVNPAFPMLEGRNVMDIKDVEGKFPVRDMFSVANSTGSGWVNYMWPKPGQSVSTLKSTFVKKASFKGKEYLVSCGTYLADAPKSEKKLNVIKSGELLTLVNEAAAVFSRKGEAAYPDFREKGSKWFQGDTYFFVWTTDGIRKFHAANPESEGKDVKDFRDAQGREIGRMILEAGNSAAGAGWVHYIYPEPGSIFPIWKSSYVKRVTFPSGKQFIIGCGIYNMALDKPIIEDLVERACGLVEKQGRKAFSSLRDKAGPFVFMDTYIFMVSPEGTEVFNADMPELEGKNILDLKDLKGNNLVRDEIKLAMEKGKGWIDGYWYKPGDNKPALKHTFVRKVNCDGKTYILGSGFYPESD